jgi:hypothetical protein
MRAATANDAPLVSSPLKNRTRAANGFSASWRRCEILNKSYNFASGFAPCPDAEILIFASAPVFQRTAGPDEARVDQSTW